MTLPDKIEAAGEGSRELPRLQSTYAILDIMRGRKALARQLKKDGPVRVLIEATITEPFGSDDGTSIEFNCAVHSVTYLRARDSQ